MMRKFTLVLILSAVPGVLAIAAGQASLDNAIKSLDARVKSEADKKAALYAVSQQTDVSQATVQAHMKSTGLNYGELMTAELLAAARHKDVASVMAMKSGKDWEALSKEMKIDPSSISGRIANAEKMIQAGVGKVAKAKPGQSAAPPRVDAPKPQTGGMRY